MVLSAFRQRNKQIHEQNIELSCENKPLCEQNPTAMAKENLALAIPQQPLMYFHQIVIEQNIKVVLRIDFGLLFPRRNY